MQANVSFQVPICISRGRGRGADGNSTQTRLPFWGCGQSATPDLEGRPTVANAVPASGVLPIPEAAIDTPHDMFVDHDHPRSP